MSYRNRLYEATLVSYNQNTDTYEADISIDGKPSEQHSFEGKEVRRLNPGISIGGFGMRLQRWN